MRDDPFYLSKALTLKASLGVLLVDGNFEDSISYFEFFVKFRFYRSIETLCADVFCLYELLLYVYLRRKEDIPTYGYLSLSARFYFVRILINGAIAIAPYEHGNVLTNCKKNCKELNIP